MQNLVYLYVFSVYFSQNDFDKIYRIHTLQFLI